MKSKLKNKSHTNNSSIQNNLQEINYSTPAKPLDFSFKEITSMFDLKKSQPRSGIRKQVKETNEKETDKEKQEMDQDLTIDNQKRKHNETKEEVIVGGRIFSDKTVDTNKNKGINKAQEIFEVKKTTKKIKYLPYTNTVIMHSNQIKSLEGINDVMVEIIPEVEFILHDSVFHKLDLIQWLDLSHNKLSTIHPDILELKYLKIFYCHANCITDLSEVTILGNCKALLNLTLHGNPIEHIKGYRLFVIEMMSCIEKLDFTLVSEKELDIIFYRGSRYGEKRNKLTGKVMKYPSVDEEVLKSLKITKDDKKD